MTPPKANTIDLISLGIKATSVLVLSKTVKNTNTEKAYITRQAIKTFLDTFICFKLLLALL